MPQTIEEAELSGLTLVNCRDAMIDCFFELHKQSGLRPVSWVSLPAQLEIYSHTTVMGTVRMIFTELGEDFRQPTALGLSRVLTLLAMKATTWDIPNEKIRKSRQQLQNLINLAR